VTVSAGLRAEVESEDGALAAATKREGLITAGAGAAVALGTGSGVTSVTLLLVR
jgi:hypothetical protein